MEGMFCLFLALLLLSVLDVAFVGDSLIDDTLDIDFVNDNFFLDDWFPDDASLVDDNVLCLRLIVLLGEGEFVVSNSEGEPNPELLGFD